MAVASPISTFYLESMRDFSISPSILLNRFEFLFRPSAKPFRLLSLPTELISHIFSSLTDFTDYPSQREDQKTFFNLCLVSRFSRVLVEPILYEYPRLKHSFVQEGEVDELDLFLRRIEQGLTSNNSNCISKRVRYIHFELGRLFEVYEREGTYDVPVRRFMNRFWNSISKILSLCTLIQGIGISPSGGIFDEDYLLSPFSLPASLWKSINVHDLRVLRLECQKLDTPSSTFVPEAYQVLERATSLEKIFISNLTTWDSQNSTFPRLKSLILRNCLAEVGISLISTSPNLQYFDWFSRNFRQPEMELFEPLSSLSNLKSFSFVHLGCWDPLPSEMNITSRIANLRKLESLRISICLYPNGSVVSAPPSAFPKLRNLSLVCCSRNNVQYLESSLSSLQESCLCLEWLELISAADDKESSGRSREKIARVAFRDGLKPSFERTDWKESLFERMACPIGL